MSINDDTSPTTVSYGGTVIARLEAGRTATLGCARKRMKADIMIVAGSGGGSGSGSGGGKKMYANAFPATVAVARVTVERPNFTSSVIVEVTE